MFYATLSHSFPLFSNLVFETCASCTRFRCLSLLSSSLPFFNSQCMYFLPSSPSSNKSITSSFRTAHMKETSVIDKLQFLFVQENHAISLTPPQTFSLSMCAHDLVLELLPPYTFHPYSLSHSSLLKTIKNRPKCTHTYQFYSTSKK